MALVPIPQIMGRIRAAEERGLAAAAEAIAEQSDRFAPRDTERLVESRRIEAGVSGAGGPQVAITYGEGLEDPRAVIVHEKTEIRHDNGGAKYLERAMADGVAGARIRIAAELRRELS